MNERVDYSRIGAHEAHSMQQVVQSLLRSVDLAATIADIIKQDSNADASAFLKYASEQLLTAGGEKLAAARNTRHLKILEPENGRLAHIVYPNGFSPSLTSTLLSVECAINRLICISDAICDGICEKNPLRKDHRISISPLGGGFLAQNGGWRSSRVVLPPLPSPSSITTNYYLEVDWRSTDCVASNARAIFQRSLRPNSYKTTFDINAGNQSDWDVRTRLAQILKALELPYRYSFRFDYDVDSQVVEVVFTCPPPRFLPALTYTDTTLNEASVRNRAYESYLIRLVCLFCAGCFGSGRGVSHAIATGYDASWSKPIVSAHFNRDDFVKSVLMAVDSHEFSSEKLRFEPYAISDMAKALHLDWEGHQDDGTLREVTLPSLRLSSLRKDPWNDDRALPKPAQDLFRCKRICDVDTSHYHGGHSDSVDHARHDADDSSMAAILRLESLIEKLEAETGPPDDDASARPLYAPNAFARLAIGLLDDEMAVSTQAEAFLHGDQALLHNTEGFPRYYRAPDALYHAHFGLSDLYQRIGDLAGAALQADRCIALAPTTSSAYLRKADILADQGYLAQACNVLIAGLHIAVTSSDCSLLYYHLGLLLWNLGKRREAAAVHVYNTSLQGEYAARSTKVVKGMREKGDEPEMANLTPLRAANELSTFGFPIAPVSIRELIVQATIFLANAGSPKAAAPYAHELERRCGHDDVIIAACRSLQYGACKA